MVTLCLVQIPAMLEERFLQSLHISETYMEQNLLECRLSGAGDLLRPAEPCSRDGAACGSPPPNVPTNDQVFIPPVFNVLHNQCALVTMAPQLALVL